MALRGDIPSDYRADLDDIEPPSAPQLAHTDRDASRRSRHMNSFYDEFLARCRAIKGAVATGVAAMFGAEPGVEPPAPGEPAGSSNAQADVPGLANAMGAMPMEVVPAKPSAEPASGVQYCRPAPPGPPGRANVSLESWLMCPAYASCTGLRDHDVARVRPPHSSQSPS